MRHTINSTVATTAKFQSINPFVSKFKYNITNRNADDVLKNIEDYHAIYPHKHILAVIENTISGSANKDYQLLHLPPNNTQSDSDNLESARFKIYEPGPYHLDCVFTDKARFTTIPLNYAEIGATDTLDLVENMIDTIIRIRIPEDVMSLLVKHQAFLDTSDFEAVYNRYIEAINHDTKQTQQIEASNNDTNQLTPFEQSQLDFLTLACQQQPQIKLALQKVQACRKKTEAQQMHDTSEHDHTLTNQAFLVAKQNLNRLLKAYIVKMQNQLTHLRQILQENGGLIRARLAGLEQSEQDDVFQETHQMTMAIQERLQPLKHKKRYLTGYTIMMAAIGLCLSVPSMKILLALNLHFTSLALLPMATGCIGLVLTLFATYRLFNAHHINGNTHQQLAFKKTFNSYAQHTFFKSFMSAGAVFGTGCAMSLSALPHFSIISWPVSHIVGIACLLIGGIGLGITFYNEQHHTSLTACMRDLKWIEASVPSVFKQAIHNPNEASPALAGDVEMQQVPLLEGMR